MSTTSTPASTPASNTATTRPTGPFLTGLTVFSALAVATVLFQFITAGQLFPSGGPDEAHAAGAIVLHVMSGLAAVAAVVLWRQGAATVGLAVLAVVVFAYGFLQAAIGGYRSLYVHVPGAMLLTAGVVWLLVAATRLRSR